MHRENRSNNRCARDIDNYSIGREEDDSLNCRMYEPRIVRFLWEKGHLIPVRLPPEPEVPLVKGWGGGGGKEGYNGESRRTAR